MATPAAPVRRSRSRRAMTDEAKDRRREQILRAAKRVFARKGFHATTISDIAKSARVSYGSVYWYFDSKDALFHALMDNEEQALRNGIAEAIEGLGDPGPDGMDALRAAVRATFEFFENDKGSVKLLFRDSYALGGSVEKHVFSIYERFIDDIEQLIEAGQRAGYVVAGPPRVMAFSVAALIGQIAHRRLTTDDGLDAAVVADFVVTLLVEGLRPRK